MAWIYLELGCLVTFRPPPNVLMYVMLISNAGIFGEELACKYLKTHGFEILARNWHCKYGELDIVTQKDKKLIFFEVKYRKTTAYGKTHEFIDFKKKKKLLYTIQTYLLNLGYGSLSWRLDALCLTKTPGKLAIEHFENLLEDFPVECL